MSNKRYVAPPGIAGSNRGQNEFEVFVHTWLGRQSVVLWALLTRVQISAGIVVARQCFQIPGMRRNHTVSHPHQAEETHTMDGSSDPTFRLISSFC
ncbi:hypothetical protein AVEN_182159-1 [Araneus ventricosus]|uniref:Uncharacterized protein n=1 Tax=Araneus ventricosus TaxID=182803 RepID=A0A4Y2Q3J5_ARAVE|nr:hypothetical protein AVEN_182159-1 [Araneus ventricosus]